jgi:hypothetical protein
VALPCDSSRCPSNQTWAAAGVGSSLRGHCSLGGVEYLARTDVCSPRINKASSIVHGRLCDIESGGGGRLGSCTRTCVVEGCWLGGSGSTPGGERCFLLHSIQTDCGSHPASCPVDANYLTYGLLQIRYVGPLNPTQQILLHRTPDSLTMQAQLGFLFLYVYWHTCKQQFVSEQ